MRQCKRILGLGELRLGVCAKPAAGFDVKRTLWIAKVGVVLGGERAHTGRLGKDLNVGERHSIASEKWALRP
jgi:hypothetical protein